MEESNLIFNIGQTRPSNFSHSFDLSFAISSTNALAPHFPDEITSGPMESSKLTIQSSLSPLFTLMRSQHSAPTEINFMPMASLFSMLHSNDVNTSMGNFSTTNPMRFSANSQHTPLTLFPNLSIPIQNNQCMYNFQTEAPPKPRHQSLRRPSDLFMRENQASYNFGYGLSNPYLMNTNPNYRYLIGNSGYGINLNRRPLFQEPTRIFRCSTCRIEFPTAQAYGGHMSSHSKAKKAKEKLEATMREAKRQRLCREPYPFLDLLKRVNKSMVVNEKAKAVPKECDAAGKGKNVMLQTLKEAEEIPVDVPGYISDESVSSEFYIEKKD